MFAVAGVSREEKVSPPYMLCIPGRGLCGVLVSPQHSCREGTGLFLSPPEPQRKYQALVQPGDGSLRRVPPWATFSAAGKWLCFLKSARQCEPRARTWALGKQGPRGTTLPILFFPDARERTPKALLGKQERSAIRAKRESLCESSAFAEK